MIPSILDVKLTTEFSHLPNTTHGLDSLLYCRVLNAVSSGFRYEWYRNNARIEGAYLPAYRQRNANGMQNWNYSCQVSHRCGVKSEDNTSIIISKLGPSGLFMYPWGPNYVPKRSIYVPMGTKLCTQGDQIMYPRGSNYVPMGIKLCTYGDQIMYPRGSNYVPMGIKLCTQQGDQIMYPWGPNYVPHEDQMGLLITLF